MLEVVDGDLLEHVGSKTPWTHIYLLQPPGMPRSGQIFGGVILLLFVLVVVMGGDILNFNSEFDNNLSVAPKLRK